MVTNGLWAFGDKIYVQEKKKIYVQKLCYSVILSSKKI